MVANRAVAFTPAEINAIIDYAQRKFAEQRYPYSPALRLVREAMAKLDPRPQVGAGSTGHALCAEWIIAYVWYNPYAGSV